MGTVLAHWNFLFHLEDVQDELGVEQGCPNFIIKWLHMLEKKVLNLLNFIVIKWLYEIKSSGPRYIFLKVNYWIYLLLKKRCQNPDDSIAL